MTIPVTYGSDGGALVHLPRNLVGVRTPGQAHEIADVFRSVAAQLEEFERAEGSRKDRAAARAVNAALRIVNVGPVGTVSPTSTVVRQHIVPGGCDCSCSEHCDACGSDGAA